nr:MoxR family ATPase [Cystobacter fuscus]
MVATQNPLEFEGTYPLPEAQLDRFLMRVRVGDPPPEAELDMVRAFHQRQGRPPQVERVPDAPTLLELQARAASVACDDSILDYTVPSVAGGAVSGVMLSILDTRSVVVASLCSPNVSSSSNSSRRPGG